MFEKDKMVDVEPFPIFPTKRNGRLGENGIVKGLDRFFLSNSLLENLDKYRTLVDSNRLSNHYPIICHFVERADKLKRPF